MATIHDIRRGLEILSKYTEAGASEHIGGAEHDVIYGPPLLKNEEIIPDDLKALDDCGWIFDEDEDGWFCFV